MGDVSQVQIIKLADQPGWTAAPGVHMRAAFGTGAMLNRVELEPGAQVLLHSHPHEQLGLVVSGTLIIEIAGVKHRLGPNDAYVIPGGIDHAGQGGPDGCVVIDVFDPVREDYRAAMQDSAAVE